MPVDARSRSLGVVGFDAASTAVLTAALGTKGIGTPFLVVFAVFLVAFLVLAVVTIRWAVRRDRVGRAEWARRHADAAAAGTVPLGKAGPKTNGHQPARGGHRGTGAGPRQAG